MKTSIQDSEKSVEHAEGVSVLMGQIIESIKQISSANHSVANATVEQNDLVKVLDADITSMSDLSVQSQENLKNTLNECTKLKQQFSDLEQMVQKFRV